MTHAFFYTSWENSERHSSGLFRVRACWLFTPAAQCLLTHCCAHPNTKQPFCSYVMQDTKDIFWSSWDCVQRWTLVLCDTSATISSVQLEDETMQAHMPHSGPLATGESSQVEGFGCPTAKTLGSGYNLSFTSENAAKDETCILTKYQLVPYLIFSATGSMLIPAISRLHPKLLKTNWCSQVEELQHFASLFWRNKSLEWRKMN